MDRNATPDEVLDLIWTRASAVARKCLACGAAIDTKRGMLFEREDWMLAHLKEAETHRPARRDTLSA